MNRNLDGVYFRVKDEKTKTYVNSCFSDLTEEQMNEVLKGRSATWLRSMCIILGKTIKQIGDDLDIVSERI